MEKTIKITTDKQKFFKQYLNILSPILQLRNKELDVLSQLMFFNNELKTIDVEHRDKILFDYDTKIKISENLKISMQYIDNCFTVLRKKGIIINNKLSPKFHLHPETNFKLSFNFTIQ